MYKIWFSSYYHSTYTLKGRSSRSAFSSDGGRALCLPSSSLLGRTLALVPGEVVLAQRTLSEAGLAELAQVAAAASLALGMREPSAVAVRVSLGSACALSGERLGLGFDCALGRGTFLDLLGRNSGCSRLGRELARINGVGSVGFGGGGGLSSGGGLGGGHRLVVAAVRNLRAVGVVLVLGVPEVVPPLSKVARDEGRGGRCVGVLRRQRRRGTRRGRVRCASGGGRGSLLRTRSPSVLAVVFLVMLAVVLAVTVLLVVFLVVLLARSCRSQGSIGIGSSTGSSESIRTAGSEFLGSGRSAGTYGGGLSNSRGDLTNNEVFKVIVEHTGIETVVIGIVALSKVVRVLHGESHGGGSAVGDAGDESKSNFGRHID
jgi:hypothetical protein